MIIPFYEVSAFTHEPSKGNPAAVCVLDVPLADALLQTIAAEINFSETAFLLRTPAGYNLRWFSPLKEMPLCGHATLAAAHILWEEGKEPLDKTIPFDTLSGVLTAARRTDGWIEMDFPARPVEPCAIPDELPELFPGGYENIVYSVDRYIVELSSADAVRAFVSDAPFLREHRLVITSRAEKDSPYDFISRYFAWPLGVPEDPVTGTAHCSLAVYWAPRLNKTTFFAWQASSRGGEMKITLHGDRISLSGQAVTVSKFLRTFSA